MCLPLVCPQTRSAETSEGASADFARTPSSDCGREQGTVVQECAPISDALLWDMLHKHAKLVKSSVLVFLICFPSPFMFITGNSHTRWHISL